MVRHSVQEKLINMDHKQILFSTINNSSELLIYCKEATVRLGQYRPLFKVNPTVYGSVSGSD